MPWWRDDLCMECALRGRGTLNDVEKATLARIVRKADAVAADVRESQDPGIRSVLQTLDLLADVINYIDKHAGEIFVREQGPDGHWGSFSLLQLPARKALDHAFRFIRLGQLPHRVSRSGQ